MAKYVYNEKLEAFRRVDNRGKPLYINITEANRIVSLLNLGHSIADINGKISLSNPKGTATTVNSFIKNYKAGNIEIPLDAPAPVHSFESLSDSNRIDALEERVSRLEKVLDNTENSTMDKVKTWLKF